MTRLQTPEKPIGIPQPEKEPEIKRPDYPEGLCKPVEDTGFVPFENPFEVPPYEVPPPGEGFK